MRRKARKRSDTFIVTFIVMLLSASALSKIFHVEPVVQNLTRVGVGKFITALGIIELLLAALFISTRTMMLSFILLSCYFSGAIATELSHGGNFVAPIVFLAVIWLTSFLRQRSLLRIPGRRSDEPNPWNSNWMMVE